MFGKCMVVMVIPCLLVIINSIIVYCLNWEILFLDQIQPNYAMIFEDTNLTVYCWSMSPVNWSFAQIGRSLPSSPVSSGHLIGYKNITLVNLQVEDSGYYNCHCYYNNRPFPVRSSLVLVVIYGTLLS